MSRPYARYTPDQLAAKEKEWRDKLAAAKTGEEKWIARNRLAEIQEEHTARLPKVWSAS